MEWTQDRDISEALAYHWARYAVDLARRELKPQPSLPYALEQLGWVLLYRGDHQGAIAAAQEAVQLNPNFAEGYALWAHVLSYLGEPREALPKMAEAIRLNPRYPFLYAYNLGHVYYVLGYLTGEHDYYQEAEKHLREALSRNKNHRPSRAYLVAVLSELGGRQAEARQHMAFLREAGRPLATRDDPRFQAYIRRSLPYKDPAILDRLIELWQAAEE
jgi:tetratricopeptide (TPR) repeat protein